MANERRLYLYVVVSGLVRFAMKSTDFLSLGEYEKKYRKYEAYGAGFVLPSMYAVLRIDAHRYGKKEWDSFPHHDYPLSEPIWAALMKSAQELMCSEQAYSYAFVHGDEISVLLDTGEREQERRRDRIISAATSVASTAFFEASGRRVVFHAKLSELPTLEHTVHYFIWQRKTAQRNFLSRHVTILAEKGEISSGDQQRMLALPQEELFAELTRSGFDLASKPLSLRFGSGLWWSPHAEVLEQCNVLGTEDESYGAFLQNTLQLRGRRLENRAEGIVVKNVLMPSEAAASTVDRASPIRSPHGHKNRGNTRIFAR